MSRYHTVLDCFVETPTNAVAIVPVTPSQLDALLASETAFNRQWLQTIDFKAKPGEIGLIPSLDGNLSQVMVGLDETDLFTSIGSLPVKLPQADYYFTGRLLELPLSFLIWGLGSYQFNAFKTPNVKRPRLHFTDIAPYKSLIEGCYLTRDLINLPAEHMGPAELADAAKQLAAQHQAEFKEIVGEALLTENFPAIYVVGRASHRPPRLLELTWGQASLPCVTLVGKGVCFDTGGLDLKNASGMRYMKKDMGGAAHVLGLAHAIMASQLPIRLRVLISAVDNAIAADAYRPGDVIQTRQGLSVEIGNTDAEGRVVLSDALTYAGETPTDLLIDFTTLTGAARVAVGAEIAAYFTNTSALATDLNRVAETLEDPIWQLPLYHGYSKYIKSDIADITNSGSERLAGATTAALFLESFVSDKQPWLHFDVMAWNPSTRAGHPEGGEAMGLRAVFELLTYRYDARNR